jgi:hypothetical protein
MMPDPTRALKSLAKDKQLSPQKNECVQGTRGMDVDLSCASFKIVNSIRIPRHCSRKTGIRLSSFHDQLE